MLIKQPLPEIELKPIDIDTWLYVYAKNECCLYL